MSWVTTYFPGALETLHAKPQKRHVAFRKAPVAIDWTDTDDGVTCCEDPAVLSLRYVREWAVVEANQLLRLQRRHGIGAPLIIAKLDLGD
jgi:hypothetical protein